MKILRPEDYANKHLYNALQISRTSEDGVHDLRVEIRKYYDVLSSLYPLYQNPDCLSLTRTLLRSLGKVRDMDICSLEIENRDEILWRIIEKKRSLSSCVIRKIYGSRLVVFNRLIKIYSLIPQLSDFHELRKNIRIARNLTESLGYDSQELKSLAKNMGDLRDEMLRMKCKGLQSPDIDISHYKSVARKIMLRILLSQEEFHHYNQLYKTN